MSCLTHFDTTEYEYMICIFYIYTYIYTLYLEYASVGEPRCRLQVQLRPLRNEALTIQCCCSDFLHSCPHPLVLWKSHLSPNPCRFGLYIFNNFGKAPTKDSLLLKAWWPDLRACFQVARWGASRQFGGQKWRWMKVSLLPQRPQN